MPREITSDQALKACLEMVACLLCGETRSARWARRQGMQIMRCVSCDLVYVNPRLDATALDRHYNHGQSSRIQYYLETEVADRHTFVEILDLAETLLRSRGRLLDIGPNIGTSLVLARERGWETHGVEINITAARYCREQRGLDVRSGTLEEGMYLPESLDVVLMADVIEHLPDPLKAMRIVTRILRRGGMVFITTPNIARWAARLLQIKPEEHLCYFTPTTMAALLAKAGLEVVRLESIDRYHNLTAMTHSTTLGGLLQRMGPLLRLAHRLVGDVVLKLPLREHLLAVGRRPEGPDRT